jgi:hypothetical protein
MAYINKGDMLLTSRGEKVIATGSDYLRRVPGNGEFIDDWTIVPTVDVLYPDRGGVTGTLRLGDVRKL